MTPDTLNQIPFHLLRPGWLLAIIPGLLFFMYLHKKSRASTGWASVIDSDLLDALLDNPQESGRKNWPMVALLLAWILAAIAMAGPCFEKSDQKALKQADAVVILLDLSPSMLARDVQPSRLQVAHYKILDLLHQRREGYTGLIAYSGSAHVVAPLSDDTNTIAALVSTLEPRIMPGIGSQAEDAVSEGLQLLENSSFKRGRMVLITDGVVPGALDNIRMQLSGKDVELHVIGVGTADGAPIALSNGNYVKDENGRIIINKLDEPVLAKLAQENGGRYNKLRTDDSDIAALIAAPAWLVQTGNGDQRDASHTIENWRDSGYLFALPCLLVALLFFRRGVLVCLLPLVFLTHHEPASADIVWPETWEDWWQTPDQQGWRALENGDVATAAQKFVDPQWKAYAEYQNGQHKDAAEHFATSQTSTAHYNRGNALAKAGDLQNALDEYDKALKQQPDLEQARFNRDLVEKLLEQQKKQQENQKKGDQQKDEQKPDNPKHDDQNRSDQEQSGDQKSDQQQRKPSDKPDQSDTEELNDQQNPDEQKSGEEKSADEKDTNLEKQEKQEDPAEQDKDKSASENENGKEATHKNEATIDSMSLADREKQQATEQWLRKVPDDPGGLLKNKFEYYYQLNRQNEARKQRNGVKNNGEQRW